MLQADRLLPVLAQLLPELGNSTPSSCPSPRNPHSSALDSSVSHRICAGDVS